VYDVLRRRRFDPARGLELTLGVFGGICTACRIHHRNEGVLHSSTDTEMRNKTLEKKSGIVGASASASASQRIMSHVRATVIFGPGASSEPTKPILAVLSGVAPLFADMNP
jgi:hypothetical protein